jgi:sulfur relay protein TusB/DsrH
VLRYATAQHELHVVLMQEGVYAAQALVDSGKQLKCFALAPDWAASGLPVISGVELIEYQEWASLCALKHPVMTVQ